jgi:hypothetical protein
MLENFMPAILLALICSVAADAPPDTIVVCPSSFRAAMSPWLDYRQQQGHIVKIVSGDQSTDEIRAAIRQTARGGALRHIVLVGDAEPSAADDPAIRARCTPVHLQPAKVNIHWGSEPQIATDNWYADLDDDELPDMAIGRLSADDVEQLRVVIDKIVRYEKSLDHGTWRRQINCIAGVGGFGMVADTVLETATKKFLTDGIPAAYQTSMTYGSWQSPFCPDPREFHNITLDRMNEGCLFWVYIGHGARQSLDRVRTPAGTHHILSANDRQKIKSQQGLPIAIFLACYTGAFDHAQDCLGEELLRAPSGPVAVFCGSRVTMPYAMAVLSNALMDEFFHVRRPTLGQVVMHAKRRLVTEDADDANRQFLDAIAKAISPAPQLMADERREHLALFNLLGDPLLRLDHPHPVRIEAATDVAAGDTLAVSLTSPIAGRGVIELVCRRDRQKAAFPARREYQPSDDFLRTFAGAYRQANDQVWMSREITLDDEAVELQFPVPIEARGHCHLRVHLQGDRTLAVGAANLYVARPKSDLR